MNLNLFFCKSIENRSTSNLHFFFKEKAYVSLHIFYILLLTTSQFSAQTNHSKGTTSQSNLAQEERVFNLNCVPPTSANYTNNSAFYCTGIPILPNFLTYSGSAATSYILSPDLPVGLSFNTTNGTITGTPTVAVAGNYSVIINSPCGSTTKTIYIAVSSGTNYYADTDGDGYGTGVATVSCSGQPEGTSTNSTDCDPNNPAKWRTSNLFIDQDNDGYSNGFPPVPMCYGAIIPTGYTLVYIGVDCLDNNKKANPNAVELPNNSIDDNCDGVIDEVSATSYLISSSCGSSVPNLSTTLYAQPIAGAQGYRFEVTNGSNIGVYETTVNHFNLLNLYTGDTFSNTSTTNSVRVAIKIGNFWRAYGSTCNVFTPPGPYPTSVINSICGTFLKDVWNTIFCYNIPGATGYRFRVKNGNTVIGTVDKPTNSFCMVDLGINNLVFATTYTVDVLLQFNDVWMPDSEYGSGCIITMPPTPGVSRITSPSCGSTTTNLWTSIFAMPITGAQGYKFALNNGIQFVEIITPISSASIHSIPGGVMRGTTYTIRVDVLYNNSYVPGREVCTLTVLPSATRLTNDRLPFLEVKSFPNPFTNNFKLEVNTSIDEQVEVRVYDMLGRQVEFFQDSVENSNNLEIGSYYPSGVYSLIVTQGELVKTLRIVKR